MKHPIETHNHFIELRAAGESFGVISEKLNVSKSTLHDWEDDHEADIARLRRLLWEETEAEFGERIEDQLTQLVCYMKDCEFRIRQFNLKEYTFRDAFTILRESRREYYRLRGILMGTGRPSRKAAKTERSHENGTTQPLCTNDLQQSKPESFHFVTPDSLPSPASADAVSGSPDLKPLEPSVQSVQSVVNSDSPEPNKTERSTETTPSQPRSINDLQQSSAESFGPHGVPSVAPKSDEGGLAGEMSAESNELTIKPEPPPTESHNSHDSHTSHPGTPELEPGDEFTGSTPYNPEECSQAILQKCLETERLHRERKSAA